MDFRHTGVHTSEASAPACRRPYCLRALPNSQSHHFAHGPHRRRTCSGAHPHRPGKDDGRRASRHRDHHHRRNCDHAISCGSGRQPRSLAGLGGSRWSRHRPGCAEHRARHAQRNPHLVGRPVQRRRYDQDCRRIRRGRVHDLAQDNSARRGWHALRHSKLPDHHRGKPEHRLLSSHGQYQRRFLRAPRQGDGTAQKHCDGYPQQRGVQRRVRCRSAGAGRGCGERLGADLPRGLQNPRHAAICPGARVSTPRPAGA